MTWQILTIPEDAAELGPWLDRQLVGLKLRELVSELAGMHDHQADHISAESILGEKKREFLARGFTSLDDTLLPKILAHPNVLFELQDLVFESGGDYWYSLQRDDPELQDHVNRARQRAVEIATAKPSIEPAAASLKNPKMAPWYARPAVASLATAATMLVVFITYEVFQSPAPRPIDSQSAAASWGWAKPGALPTDVSAAAYFDTLASSAEAWFNKRPEDALAVARRVSDFRQGCTVLLLSNHAPLNDEQKQWLDTKCRAWAVKLEKHRADLEAGANPLAVRDQADATINALILALRERAEMI